MKNNLYQIELRSDDERERLSGYVLTEQDNFLGILYTDTLNEFDFIYGKYDPNNKAEIVINSVPSGQYQFNNKLYDRDGNPYERFFLSHNQEFKNKTIFFKHYNLNVGYEIGRVSDISTFVNNQFDKHMVDDKNFAKSYISYLGDIDSFQKNKKLVLSNDVPF